MTTWVCISYDEILLSQLFVYSQRLAVNCAITLLILYSSCKYFKCDIKTDPHNFFFLFFFMSKLCCAIQLLSKSFTLVLLGLVS